MKNITSSVVVEVVVVVEDVVVEVVLVLLGSGDMTYKSDYNGI